MLKVNSKKIEQGDTFIAIKSETRDGHDYIEDAIDRGAACIIAQRGEYSVKTIIVPDTRVYLSQYLKDLYLDKLSKVKIIGVTGTNGKTSSCYFIYELLNKMNIKTAYIGTLGFYTPNKKIETTNTTPDLFELYEMISKSVDEECEFVVMEVSSHAINARRIEGIKFDIVCFTNLVKDHLDYHKTMSEYKSSKVEMFKQLSKKGYAIINADDKHSREFILNNNKNILFGKGNNDYRITNISLSSSGSSFTIKSDKDYNINFPIAGLYNIYNYMYVFIICDRLGLDIDEVIDKTNELTSPLGRYQVVKKENKTVIIDYAHTPNAILNIINSVKEYSSGRIITLIGAGGDRDKHERPIIGKTAVENSDFVYFTSDNSRSEKPEDILNAITGNLDANNYEIIVDRGEAIKKAIHTLEDNDVLLVLGKGHEEYQIIGSNKIPFKDIEEVKKHFK